MPSEYVALVAALKLTSVPFQEYGWKPRPEGVYGIVGLDFEAGSLDGDGEKLDRAHGGSVDLFFPKLVNRDTLVEEIEETLTEVLGNAWELNSVQYERETGMFHVEWAFECLNDDSEDDDSEESGDP